MRRIKPALAIFAVLPLVMGTGTVAGGATLAPPGVGETAVGAFTASPDAQSPTTTSARSLRVATRSLPSAERTRRYRVALSQAGGAGPVRWSVTAGALPAGLSLSRRGILSGVPRRSGAVAFSVTVRDARGARSTRALTLVVAPRGGVVLTGTSVGPVKFPAVPAAAGTVWRRVFGGPSLDKAGPGCPLGDPGQRSHVMVWGDLQVYGEGATTAQVRIDSWAVLGTRVPARLALPYKVDVGTTMSALRARVPGVTVITDDVFSSGDYLATKGEMTWWVGRRTLKVYRVDANVYFCD